MLSKETACPPPTRYHTSQPVAQPANITVSPHPGFSRGAGRAGRGRAQAWGSSTLKEKKKGDSEQQGLFTFQGLFRCRLLPANTHTHARRGARLQLLTEEGERADLQPEFATKWNRGEGPRD